MKRPTWIEINEHTELMKVIGGWVLRTHGYTNIEEGGVAMSEALCFIPDKEHVWQNE